MGQIFPYSFAPLKPISFISDAVSSSAVTTLTLPAKTIGALVQSTGGNINWRDDGTAPTSASGGGIVLVADAEPQWFPLISLETFQAIAAGASTYLLVSYYG